MRSWPQNPVARSTDAYRDYTNASALEGQTRTRLEDQVFNSLFFQDEYWHKPGALVTMKPGHSHVSARTANTRRDNYSGDKPSLYLMADMATLYTTNSGTDDRYEYCPERQMVNLRNISEKRKTIRTVMTRLKVPGCRPADQRRHLNLS